MPRIIFSTLCDNSEVDAPSFVYVDFTPELIARIEARAQLFASSHGHDSQLTQMEFYDFSAKFFHADCTSEAGAQLDGESITAEWFQFAENIPDNWTVATDCDRFVITHYGDFWFQACEKHADWTIRTKNMSLMDFREQFQQELAHV